MMAGSWGLSDSVDYTALSESSPRNRGIDTLQIHHATTTSLSGLIGLMQPGGRQVSANGAMGNDGHLVEVVRTVDRRAFTSASAFDNQSLTVEVCNTTLSPTWGISEASRIRLARLAVGMYRNRILGGFHRGIGGIIGHYEVPGTYATACPGPDMNLDHIAALARQFYDAGDPGTAGGEPISIQEDDMGFELKRRKSNGAIEFRDEYGTENLAAYGTGLSNAELIAAANAAWGIQEIPDREFDVSRQIAGRRISAFMDGQREAIVKQLEPIIVDTVNKAVAAALDNVTIPPSAPVDYAALAKAVNDDLHNRTKE